MLFSSELDIYVLVSNYLRWAVLIEYLCCVLGAEEESSGTIAGAIVIVELVV